MKNTGSIIGFNKVYKVTFAFYVERMAFSSCQGVTINHGNPGSLSYQSCSASGKKFTVLYRESIDTDNGNGWPSWNSGDHIDLTFTFGSMTGDATPASHLIYITATMLYETVTVHSNRHSDCGCQNSDCCNDNG